MTSLMSDQPTAPASAPESDPTIGRGRSLGDRVMRGVDSVRRGGPFRIVVGILLAAYAVLVAVTLGRVVLSLVFVDGVFDPSPLVEAFTQPDLLELLGNTLLIVLTSMVLAIIIGSFFAWIGERTDAAMPRLTAIMPMLPFLMPPIAGAIGWTLLLSDRSGFLNVLARGALSWVGIELDSGPVNIYSWWGMIFLYTLYQIPFAYLMIGTGLRNADPALEEQARVAGTSAFTTLRRITIPVLRPSLGAAALFMAWFGFSFFSVPVVIGTQSGIDVLSVRIVQLMSFSYPAETTLALGLSLFLMLFVGIAWYLQGRVLRGGRYAVLGGKGSRAAVVRLGKWRRPARALLVIYLLIATVIPLSAHLLVVLNGYWTPNIRWGDLSFEYLINYLFNDPLTRESLATSLQLATIGATITVIIAAVFSHYLKSSQSRLARALDGVIKLPAVFSGIVVGLGCILVFSGPPVNIGGTIWILLLAYVILFTPQVSVAADAAAAQVGNELSEASRISGAGGAATFWKVNLRLMLPSLLAGWGLVFVWMVGELEASSMLATTTTPVVGFRILDVFINGDFALLAALSIALTVINVTVLSVVGLISRRLGGVPAARR
ncbi:ABC transporter permease [Microbacterium sp. NIBRBAC000506063]|uniref:ABC transporter permease n=1 Tax=Microbacterium sp. NIBRBAC000506063 TaxID=2734618 RepID=UPI001BB7D0C3|nr:iron ABC transporter permease [Microbacterium sp. NIBRBAC000506063]QTV80489.1 iron ABC transporter permease [Microbacterium sp. NIBRBAC000506063]